MLFHFLYWLFAKLQDFTPEAVESVTATNGFKLAYFLLFIALCLALPAYLGTFVANRLRMKDYGWKLSIIFVALAFSGEIVGRVAVDDWGRELGMQPWTTTTQRFDIKLGVDLQGGVILVYEREANADLPSDQPQAPGQPPQTNDMRMTALVEAIKRRINPSGTKEIVVRGYGANQVEIIIPEVDQRAVEQIKKQISTAGVLEFRIGANPRDHSEIIALAREMAEDPINKTSRVILNSDGDKVGLWGRVAREQGEAGTVRPFKLGVTTDVLRNARTGDLLTVTDHQADDPAQFADYIDTLEIDEIDVLMSTDDGYDVTGGHLGTVGRGHDEYMQPCILFSMRGEGVDRFSRLTREYSPDGQATRRLGILLDRELLSAPTIQEMIPGNGRITGRFSPEEVDFMVNILEAGSLPVVLNEVPISENLINPLLGAETIKQGKTAISISLVVVLIFIVFYYRFSGFVASMALLANLLFILSLMVLIKGAFTLPGLAGLVLTVGMSVDANVLIFERIREELTRGSALRMAIRNGFARATTTIVDANVTTLITAIVLYGIGTDQIRGFAVTLILGILMSMFTAIFCSRVVFDLAERARRINQLSMTRILGATEIDFVGKRWIAGAFSLVVISVGLVALAARGIDIFDIDFRGGTSVHVMFDEEVGTELVRKPLDAEFKDNGYDFTLTAMNAAGGSQNNIFKVDSSIPEVSDLQSAIERAVESSGSLDLARYSLEYFDLKTVVETAPAEDPSEDAGADTASDSERQAEAAASTAAGGETSSEPPSSAERGEPRDSTPDSGGNEPAESPETSGEDSDEELGNDCDSDGQARLFGSQVALASELLAQAETEQETTGSGGDSDAEAEPQQSGSADQEKTELEQAEQEDGDQEDVEQKDVTDEVVAEVGDEEDFPASVTGSRIEVELTFGHAINAETLSGEIQTLAEELADKAQIPVPFFELDHENWDRESSNPYKEWTLQMSATEPQVEELLSNLKTKFSNTPVWPSSSKIGGQVAGRMQNKAIASLVASLFGIVIYIWIRFQRVIFGLAAVVALVHDVLVTLGAIAISAWLAGGLGFLLIEPFKISLPIVAALLTIIGYSLNDTIVVFDRIREVRGRSPDLTGAMINKSINQTLSRTVLTSMTTLIVVLILYALGGQGIHGFAFALVVGVIVGTYSSIFVASPVLLWMTSTSKSSGRKTAAA